MLFSDHSCSLLQVHKCWPLPIDKSHMCMVFLWPWMCIILYRTPSGTFGCVILKWVKLHCSHRVSRGDKVHLYMQPKPEPQELSRLFSLISENFTSLILILEQKHKDEIIIVSLPKHVYTQSIFYIHACIHMLCRICLGVWPEQCTVPFVMGFPSPTRPSTLTVSSRMWLTSPLNG